MAWHKSIRICSTCSLFVEFGTPYLLDYMQMSLRENIQFFHQIDAEKYVGVLKDEHNAQDHPSKLGSFLVAEDHPLYAPQLIEDYLSILGFNSWLIIHQRCCHSRRSTASAVGRSYSS